MGKMKKIGCGCCCLPAIVVAAFYIGILCHPRYYEFELRMFYKAPDLNQYSVIYSRTQDGCLYHMPYGYSLYHEAMRENGIGALILTDTLLRHAGAFFGGVRATPTRIPWDGGASFFGSFPAMEFSGHSNVVATIQNSMACSNALQAIETNAVLKFRWSDGHMFEEHNPSYLDLVDDIGEMSGIGSVGDGFYGWRGITSEEDAKKCAKEAITAYAIKTVFPGLRAPRINEETPIMGKRWFWHGRAPALCHEDVVVTRTFTFYDENDCLFAFLRINVEYNSPSRFAWQLKGHREIYKAIFSEVFKELKLEQGGTVISGRSYYDAPNGVGVIRNLRRERERRE
jgi:hypothetical protein